MSITANCELLNQNDRKRYSYPMPECEPTIVPRYNRNMSRPPTKWCPKCLAECDRDYKVQLKKPGQGYCADHMREAARLSYQRSKERQRFNMETAAREALAAERAKLAVGDEDLANLNRPVVPEANRVRSDR